MVVLSMRFTPETEEEFAPFVEFVTRLSCQSLIVKHEADKDVKRTHVHLVINFGLTQSTFGQRFHAFMNKYYKIENGNKYIGNKHFSIKDCSEHGEKPLWYICKNHNPIVLYKMNYTENDIERFHQESQNYVSALKKQKQNEDTKPEKEYREKKKTLTFPQVVAKSLKELYPHGFRPTESGWDFRIREHRRVVFDHTCKLLGEHGKTLDDLIIKRLMSGVMMIIDRDSCTCLFRKKVLDSFDEQFIE